jgi:hypothetical protein
MVMPRKAFAQVMLIWVRLMPLLTTDTINFDWNSPSIYNTRHYYQQRKTHWSQLCSYANQKVHRTAPSLIKKAGVIKSNHLIIITSNHRSLFGPSTITSKANHIFTLKVFYDTKKMSPNSLREIIHKIWRPFNSRG